MTEIPILKVVEKLQEHRDEANELMGCGVALAMDAAARYLVEQLRLIFNVNDQVCDYMDAKVRRLAEKVGGASCG